ncbi:SSU ribosomal protein S6P modification protein [Methanohalophilus euhalobius]|jgi:tetrahydromethanopterin:alpha-L-glutamate ligase|uniref:SSU ribosomal protein S6P modification protein n=1 Tax=Methanohalophilus euhalobius TaxID=51203 RepID=A0A285G184_9EURY|nr:MULTISPECIES: tetrahydromethanopterin:alpha-L-glutamate ligase [Methanohalophilus]RSD34582.1 MAG: tetrahydromethanopterin:alpha-L-glutamate ligase [Methanohalophilus sp.]ODV49120.1 MAG: tetrahydromethanopterin:alpha-L-glutamate ligase [Methanohalophilus sp. 2-GBenrich]RSD35662.1 MAG: tetrahydromethanopterin:alpha-L-glutamate ligase [Methanohalophilus sp.]RXG33779.1 tetrahydromethanopterin:alpha-L-glutamate ligase [Methanohalophilus sp. WG1-DM]TCL12493.1 SSU ribosomal protein S6P modificatio
MKNIGILITDPEDWTTKSLIETASHNNINPIPINLADAEVTIGTNITYHAGDINLQDLDAIIVRDAGGGNGEGIIFRFDILRQLENFGIPVINSPASIQNAANKYHATYLLAEANIPVPPTKGVQDIESAMNALESFEDAIIKPVFGYKGKGIYRIKNAQLINPDGNLDDTPAREFVSRMMNERKMLYIQKYIANPGRDIRAFVVGDEVIGAIYRKAEGGWLYNLSQGGNTEKCMLGKEQEELCVRACEKMGAEYAGVDLIEGKDGNMVLEVNATPSGAGIYRTWGINPAEKIIDHLMERL